MMKFVPIALAACLGAHLLTAARVVEAQEASATPRQMELMSAASKASRAGNYDKGVDLYAEALQEGELNVVYLNLGRALYKVGACEEANRVFDKVLGAPAVPRPTVQQVAEALESFRGDLERTCPGSVGLVCEDNNLSVSIDGAAPRPCGKLGELTLQPGRHFIVVEQTGRIEVEVRALVHRDVRITSQTANSPDAGGAGWRTAGWTLLGGGAVSTAGLIIFDVAVGSPAFDDLQAARSDGNPELAATLEDDVDSYKTLETVWLGVSASALVAGAAILLLEPGESKPAQASVRPWVHTDSGGLVLEGTW